MLFGGPANEERPQLDMMVVVVEQHTPRGDAAFVLEDVCATVQYQFDTPTRCAWTRQEIILHGNWSFPKLLVVHRVSKSSPYRACVAAKSIMMGNARACVVVLVEVFVASCGR